jgi:hypothetical protein
LNWRRETGMLVASRVRTEGKAMVRRPNES